MKSDPCPCCLGSGFKQEPRLIGRECRRTRELVGLSLRDCAKRMDISPAYLSQLERGLVRWSPKLLALHQAACWNRTPTVQKSST